MFLHSYHPTPILFDFGFIQVHWYGFLIALGAVAGFFVFYRLARQVSFDKNIIFNLFFYLIIWGLIGGRVYHVLSEFNYYFYHPLEIFFIWQGGLGIYGAIIAGAAVVIYFSKKIAKANPLLLYYFITLLLLDLLSPALALAQAIGRFGNYFNQELYGLPTNLPWSIPIDFVHRLPDYEQFTHFHPVFLYESVFCFLLFILILLLSFPPLGFARGKLQRESRIAGSPIMSGMTHGEPGFIFLLYLFFYSSWRFFIEFLRLDPQPVFFYLRLGQWVSLALIILSLALYFVLKKWYNKTNQQKTINN